ncbi:hypothetical protein F5Y07DRAFT_118024 [Xylaria sp. FL0933]|nr:hypothetical protein F5Y07DRAFT_118024 [Xylaria sp. FL0933]
MPQPKWQRLLEITTWRAEASGAPVPLSSPWTEHLERSITRYSDHLLPLLKSFGFRAPLDVLDVVEVLITIASLLRKSTSSQDKTQSETTLAILLILLRKEYRVTADGITADCAAQNDACHQAIFILCGLLSMVYEPSTQGQARINAPDWLVAHQLVQPEVSLRTILDRPLGFFLRSYGQLLPEPRHHISQATRQVYASSLSAYSLRNIGKITFEWTGTLSNHLTFLPLTRTLLIFRYPSFCAMNLWPSGHSIFDKLLHGYYTGPDPDLSRSKSLNQEIILSYRLLFGQDSMSRPIFKQMSASQRLEDPLLSLLCTKGVGKHIYSLPSHYWPAACRYHMDAGGRLREQSTYSLNTDFPLLADRLEIMQTYMNSQKASRKRDMYRDRRNAGEWLASWPVLMLALVALLLSFLQLVVGAVQLAYTIKPRKG